MRPYLKSLASLLPGVYRLGLKARGGPTDSARYCYSVWLRHLVKAHDSGLSTEPRAIAELGPGHTLGTGIATLIAGGLEYYALDVVDYGVHARSITIFDELADLFTRRASVPDQGEFPNARPLLNSYDFPSYILTEERLNAALDRDRLRRIRETIARSSSEHPGDIRLSYIVPWDRPDVLRESSVDMVFSQAVLEHVNDLSATYEALYRWLKPEGFTSHQIDFKSHRTAKRWNGHWAYSDFKWRLITGRQPFLINRYPHSAHIDAMTKCGFEVVYETKNSDASGIERKRLAPRFRELSDDDLTTSGVFIQAVKRGEAAQVHL